MRTRLFCRLDSTLDQTLEFVACVADSDIRHATLNAYAFNPMALNAKTQANEVVEYSELLAAYMAISGQTRFALKVLLLLTDN